MSNSGAVFGAFLVEKAMVLVLDVLEAQMLGLMASAQPTS